MHASRLLHILVWIGTSRSLSRSTHDVSVNEKGDCRAFPCDVHWPSSFNNSHASTVCVQQHESKGSSFDALSAARVTVVYGASLLGEPVRHGYGIAVAQLESLHAVGLLCPGCAKVHVVLTHVPTSPLISNVDPAESAKIATINNRNNESANKNMESFRKKPSVGKQLSGRDAVHALRALLMRLSSGEATVRVLWENYWEWPALADAHAMAQQQQQELQQQEQEKQASTRLSRSGSTGAPLFLYFHNKGASHVLDATGAVTTSQFRTMDTLGGGWGRRSLAEMAAFHEVVAPWQAVLQIFDVHSEAVQHAGLAPAKGGFQWFNFMWIRPAYLAMHLPPAPPLRGLDRHYYESWLGRALNITALMNTASATVDPGDAIEDHADVPRRKELYSETTLTKRHKRSAAHFEYIEGGRTQGNAEISKGNAYQAMTSMSKSGCAVAYSLADCQVGSCGTAKWAEARLTRAKKYLDAAFRQSYRA